MDGTIDKLRQAVAEFDAADNRAWRMACAQLVLTLVRQLLSEVDAERQPEGAMVPDLLAQAYAEPLGGPHPGVDGSHLPDESDG